MHKNSDLKRNESMLKGPLRKKGYDWWWHSFTGINEETSTQKAFFIEFFTVNPAFGDDEVHYGQLGEKPSYLMIKCGAWQDEPLQLHKFFPWNEVTLNGKQPISINVSNFVLTENYTKGEVEVKDAKNHPEWMCDNGSMSWELKINKIIPYNVGYGANKFFRDINAFEMYWHAEGMKTEYEGYVILNGVKYTVSEKNSYGYADKNWGKDFTSPWIWLSSNNLVSEITGKVLSNSVFDIGGGKPKVFGISLKNKLLSNIYYEGKDYEFNFSKFWTNTKTSFNCYETEEEIIWHIEQETNRAFMITDIRCYKKDMLLVNYEAPNGKKLHNRLWNGGNGQGLIQLYEKKKKEKILIDRIICKNVGCEYGVYDNK